MKEQEDYNNKLKQYELEYSKAVEQEYPLSSHARQQIKSWQESLGLRPRDIQRIEQQINAVKYQEKLKKKQRSKEQEVETAKQLKLQKQREQEKHQKRLIERKREQEERFRPQPQENIPSQPQPSQAGFLGSNSRRIVLIGSTALGLGLIALGYIEKVITYFWVGNGILFCMVGFFLFKERRQSEEAIWWRMAFASLLINFTIFVAYSLYFIVFVFSFGLEFGLVGLGDGGAQSYGEIWYFFLLIVYLTCIYIGCW